MNEVNLLKVARALREAGDGPGFTMQLWHRCGTPACAFGHYAGRKDLQSVFKLHSDEAIRYADGSDIHDVQRTLADHFGISKGGFVELFSWDGCGGAETREEAAAYIEAFVERHREVIEAKGDRELAPVNVSDVECPLVGA